MFSVQILRKTLLIHDDFNYEETTLNVKLEKQRER